MSIAFGPIVSRRFGRSLGVNHIPLKHCTYSCVYCQLGPTKRTTIERRAFYSTGEVASAVEERARGCAFDVISFVPDGEPTLDINLGAHLRAVRHLGRTAVITNGSLLFDPEVRRDVAEADLVSIEVDAIDEHTWRRIDRPCSSLSLDIVLHGIRAFAREYRGELWTQTMLLDGYESDVSCFLRELAPRRACLSIPTRPSGVRPAGAEAIARASAAMPFAEVIGDVMDAPVHTAEELLAVLAVHPIREDAVPAEVVSRLIASAEIKRIDHTGAKFLAPISYSLAEVPDDGCAKSIAHPAK
ncbi:MAG: radical SAM protein [Thermoanaerobaculia bacterium]